LVKVNLSGQGEGEESLGKRTFVKVSEAVVKLRVNILCRVIFNTNRCPGEVL
jgi:hypothetical protein